MSANDIQASKFAVANGWTLLLSHGSKTTKSGAVMMYGPDKFALLCQQHMIRACAANLCLPHVLHEGCMYHNHNHMSAFQQTR